MRYMCIVPCIKLNLRPGEPDLIFTGSSKLPPKLRILFYPVSMTLRYGFLPNQPTMRRFHRMHVLRAAGTKRHLADKANECNMRTQSRVHVKECACGVFAESSSEYICRLTHSCLLSIESFRCEDKFCLSTRRRETSSSRSKFQMVDPTEFSIAPFALLKLYKPHLCLNTAPADKSSLSARRRGTAGPYLDAIKSQRVEPTVFGIAVFTLPALSNRNSCPSTALATSPSNVTRKYPLRLQLS
ncbi:hypothetical protein K438DRAFT_809428 [Mycena galopus ATCC 62051]|nr:hypothetical protein K438DRAFT_809428 [Mycena galopus ATCC 62051]